MISPTKTEDVMVNSMNRFLIADESDLLKMSFKLSHYDVNLIPNKETKKHTQAITLKYVKAINCILFKSMIYDEKQALDWVFTLA